jgi:hypothetical protein
MLYSARSPRQTCQDQAPRSLCATRQTGQPPGMEAAPSVATSSRKQLPANVQTPQIFSTLHTTGNQPKIVTYDNGCYHSPVASNRIR